MYTFDSQYETYLSEFNAYAEAYCKTLRTKPEVLGESMKYSLLLGGKRIRPVLMLAVADVLGAPAKEVLPYALALEMIHTYSLIHDDLSRDGQRRFSAAENPPIIKFMGKRTPFWRATDC